MTTRNDTGLGAVIDEVQAGKRAEAQSTYLDLLMLVSDRAVAANVDRPGVHASMLTDDEREILAGMVSDGIITAAQFDSDAARVSMLRRLAAEAKAAAGAMANHRPQVEIELDIAAAEEAKAAMERVAQVPIDRFKSELIVRRNAERAAEFTRSRVSGMVRDNCSPLLQEWARSLWEV